MRNLPSKRGEAVMDQQAFEMDFKELGSLDQQLLEVNRGIHVLKRIHEGMRDGPDKIAMEIAMKVLEAERGSIESKIGNCM